jgi:hypothetical protein
MRRWVVVPAFVIVAAVTLTACAGADQRGTLEQRVTAWSSATQFGQSVGTLYGDGQRIHKVIRLQRGAGAIHTDCGVLITDTGTVESNLPSPDQALTDALNSAATLDYQAGTDCYNGGGTDQALMRKANREMDQADAALRRAVARVEHLTRARVSTTTTTNPDQGLGI